MKNSHRGFAPLVLIVIAVIIIGGGAIAYSKKSDIKDMFLSPEEKVGREIQKLKQYFPETIGSYELYGRNADKISIGVECNKLENHPDTKGSGLTGEICGRTIRAEYRDASTNSVIFVHVVDLTKGKNLYKSFLQKAAKTFQLQGLDVFRLENHEIGWYPGSTFGIILTQEGTVRKMKDGSESMSYGRATGDNEVTKFFLGKYSPGPSDGSDFDISEKEIQVFQCVDSDGGQDFFKKGTVVCSRGKYVDYCSTGLDSNKLTEYISSGSSVQTDSYKCPKGCRDGACIE